MEVCVSSGTSGTWNAGLDYCGGLDSAKVFEFGFKDWALA